MSFKRNLSSLRGFWFDCATSIPFSYMDLHLYLVRGSSKLFAHPPPHSVFIADLRTPNRMLIWAVWV